MRDQLATPILTVPGYVTVVAVVLALAAIVAMFHARDLRDHERTLTARLTRRIYRDAVDHEAELSRERRHRASITQSRDEALLELNKTRALARTMAEQLDKVTKPHGWSWDGREPLTATFELEFEAEAGVDRCPAPGCGTELSTRWPGRYALTHHRDGSHSYGPKLPALEPARYPHPVTVTRESVTSGTEAG